jgi:hypothetical protein
LVQAKNTGGEFANNIGSFLEAQRGLLYLVDTGQEARQDR